MCDEIAVEAGESIEDLQLGGMRLIQDRTAFRFGTDAVLLSSFVRAGARDVIVDLGTGTGILPVLLAAKTKARRIIGIELQPRAAALAAKNIALNRLEDRVEIYQADLKTFGSVQGATVVVSNPPYDKIGAGAASKSDEIRIARHEVCCTLSDVVAAAGRQLSSGGRFYLIHRAARLGEAMGLLEKNGFAAKVLQLIEKKRGAEPRYFLMESRKGGAQGMRILPNLTLYDEDGSESAALRKIYGREEE